MNWLPEHKCGLYLTHNEHRDFYESAEEYIYNRGFEAEFISPEEMKKAIAEDSIWQLQWYPETPIGFHKICAASLEAIQEAIRARGQSEIS
jgi:hypothetical protein